MAWSEWTSAFDRELTSIRYEKRYRERGGGVARIVLACPERLNTYDVAMGREIIAAFQDANKDNTIGVVLFTHEGPHWGVGGNVQGLTDDANSEQQALYTRLLSHIPLGRPAKTSEIAHAALFLAAPESSYITGHILTVDGGWIAGYSRDF